MDKATLILRKTHQMGVSQVIPSGQQWKPRNKNGRRSLQIAAASQDLIRLLGLLQFAQCRCASSTCRFGKDVSSTLGLWSA